MLPDSALIWIDSLLLSTAQSLPILLFVFLLFLSFCFCSSFWCPLFTFFFFFCLSLFSSLSALSYHLSFLIQSLFRLSLLFSFFLFFCRSVFLPSSVGLSFLFVSCKKSEITRIKYLSRTARSRFYVSSKWVQFLCTRLFSHLSTHKQTRTLGIITVVVIRCTNRHTVTTA